MNDAENDAKFLSDNQIAASSVISLLGPLKQSLIRNLGSAGHRSFVVCTEVHLIPIYARLVTIDTLKQQSPPDAVEDVDDEEYEVYKAFPVAQSILNRVIHGDLLDSCNYRSDAESLMKHYEMVFEVPLLFQRPVDVHPTLSQQGQTSLLIPPTCCHTITCLGSHPQCGGLKHTVSTNQVQYINMGISMGLRPESFCSGYSLLKSVSIEPLVRIQVIGTNFMANCVKLETFDLTPLKNVKYIQRNFFLGCTNLRELDLSVLPKELQLLNGGFLKNCSRLKTLNLSSFVEVNSIDYGFLSGCTGVETLDFAPMQSVKTIAEGFLHGCNSLKTVDLSPMESLKRVSWNFLSNCTNLSTIVIPLNLSNDRCPAFSTWMFLQRTPTRTISLPIYFGCGLVTTVGDQFLADSDITNIDLSCFSCAIQIGNGFLQNCKNLEQIHLGMAGLLSVGDYFGSGCINLKGFSSGRSEPLISVGTFFLSSTSIKTIDDISFLLSPCVIGGWLFDQSPFRRSSTFSALKANNSTFSSGERWGTRPQHKTNKPCNLL